ncbi:anhydro-N-acetylmuramic acid kinase [Amorphus orientalis]|uniref:Anhydro-N-acetylmuramic acid kinase n=1 Tax=Amorphus orientalis TaxID=649198 RepID=A0AAE3VT86_9HYPH|nr:anhydro-N-acetylmuramic acid kinase [Amorphus orientalis]MDQ0317701.1 anhydro-N-acetylmuramic acid kinase [Amorphus orientalis]
MSIEEGTRRPLRAIGLMSGTSMDGVDVALVETDGEAAVTPGPTAFTPYPDELRTLLKRANEVALGLDDRTARPEPLAEAERWVTEIQATAVRTFVEALGAQPDVVGFHGQTVMHAPDRGLTIQLGDGQAMADRLGIPVVFDLRAADMAAGGEGAPLVPVFHRALVLQAGLELPAAVLNIGGVANVTWVGADGDLVAFDTGPGNALIDDMMEARHHQMMDEGGARASEGTVNRSVVEAYLGDSYFARPAPKSLDRSQFDRSLTDPLSTEDAAATLVAVTAESVAHGLKQLPAYPKSLTIGGGGARNPVMMEALAGAVGLEPRSADGLGWSAAFLEAQAFAYLAVRALGGLPITFPGTTGVAEPQTGGRIARP